MSDDYDKAKKKLSRIKQRNFVVANEEDFLCFYGKNDDDRECYYCRIKESEISELINKYIIKTKRLSTRGRSMEVDRIKPHLGYTKDNIKLACYWCNSAKTDEFSCEEFVSIAQEIRKVWKERLKNNIPNKICENDKLLTDWDDVNNIFFAFPYKMYSPESKKSQWCKWWEDLKRLMDEIEKQKLAVKINLVFKDHEDVVKELKKEEYDKYHQKDRAYRLIASPYLEDVWLRDFMPLAFNNNKALKAVYSPTYFNKEEEKSRKYSYNSHIAGLDIAEIVNIECHGLSKGSLYWHEEIGTKNEILPIVLDGGNFIHNGKIAFISARVLVENYYKDFEECNFTDILDENNKINEIKNLIKEKTNLEEIYILPTDKDEDEDEAEFSGHLDGTIRFIDENNLFIDKDYHDTHENLLKGIFEKNGIKACPIKQNIFPKKGSIKGSIKGIILNYLRIKNVLFIPNWDDETYKDNLKEFQKKCDKYNLDYVLVEENESISSKGGLFNCISWATKLI